ncbi:MAG: hypothetical protein WD830_12100 [Chloroflexota bacterium]
MSGFEMFCERCGKRYGSEEQTAAGSLPLAKRFLNAVGVSQSVPPAPAEEPLLRFCLACRGYSCPACWNDEAGFCQTCVPLPEPLAAEPIAEHVHEPELPVINPWVPEAPTPEPVFVEAFVTEAEISDAFTVDPVVAEAEAVFAEAEPVFVEAFITEAEVVAADAEPMAAEPEAEQLPVPDMDERPVEFVFADEEPLAEPEAEVDWARTLEPEPEPAAAAAEEPAVVAAEEPVVVVAEPEAPPAEPVPPPPPIFRPLQPLGHILPPHPPAASAPIPRLEFDLPDIPPAFVIAPPRPPQASMPVLPVGLFDGPGPTIRPCSNCELPVSAKAHFCRRCGSAQG